MQKRENSWEHLNEESIQKLQKLGISNEQTITEIFNAENREVVCIMWMTCISKLLNNHGHTLGYTVFIRILTGGHVSQITDYIDVKKAAVTYFNQYDEALAHANKISNNDTVIE